MSNPELEIIRFEDEDVIATSGGNTIVDPIQPFDPELPSDDF